ncbi:MAG: hypothetical protein KJ864_04345, partial [Candidatus Omnitrophica bacterium]|nr:hypothetical protein [Candidatus Omnitrophota bacterium]
SLEQVKQTKIKAKEEFSIKHLTYYSTHDKPSDGKVLNSDQIVISYSGRLVPKKVSKERSFYEGNIEELIKLGAQVVIYGNQQTNNTQSDELAEYFEHLTEKFKHKNYSGKLIFVPRFSLKDERWLKAVSDVGVHDSEPKSEAAGFTESNDAVCGGIVVAPLRTDNRFGEGLFTVQGIEMDRDVPGKGNTATPKTMTAEGYMEVFRMLLDKYSKDELKYYQATSIRLSRALGARSKVAEELRQISYDMSRKKAKDKARETMEEIRKMEHETKSLWGQLVVPSKEDEPKKHFVYYVSKRILDGKTDNAIRLLFTSEEFQNKKGNLDVLAEILNNLLEVFEKEPSAQENILNFTKSLIEGIVEFSGNDEESIEVAKAVQIMAGLVWIMPRGMRFTTNEKDMVQNERGKSYINARKLPEGIIEVKEETKPGLYWRHIEGVAKIKPVNIMKFAIHNKRQFENASKKIVNYIMLHGGKIISKDVMKEIESGNLSNPHETLFVNGLLRGSFQPASTGPGHLQIKMVNGKRKGVVDLKKINKGSYLQVNVRYDKSGNMRQVICQLAKQGEICFAIPGWRDYMIDIEGYGFEGFSDFSFVVSEEEAQLFDSSYRESDLEEIEKALKNKGEEDCAPYGALISKKGPLFIKANREVPEAVWIDSKAKDFTKIAFDTIYKNMSLEEKSRRCINALAQFCKSAKRDMQPLWYPDEAEGYLKKNFPTEFEPAPIFSLGMTKGIDSFISDTSECLASSGVAKQKTDKLIRIDVETLKKIKSEEVKEFLKTIQKTEHYNIRLYSSKNPELEINENEYKDFDIKKEPLPREFEMSRANTITLLMVDKGEEFPSSSHNVKWDRLGFSRKKDKNPLLSTIILPVGANYDHTGLARSIFFGLILSEIAANDELGKDSNFVAASLARFMKLYLAQGEDAKSFNLNCEDIVNLARGDVDALVASLNKLIKVLPIMPVNVNEQVEIYERAKEAWIRA